MAAAPTVVRVFAYGSNLCRERIAARVATARALMVARLDAHALHFHKRGRDGSAKADARWTGDPRDVVWGVVYEMSAADKLVLDDIEGLGNGYIERRIEIADAATGGVTASLYQADPSHIDGELKPFTWYRDLVVAGARQHRLGADYIAAIAAVESIEDPDPERRHRELAVLGTAAGI